MGVVSRLLGVGGQRADQVVAGGTDVERRGVPAPWDGVFDVGAKAVAGPRVSVDSALRQATVFACVRLLAETISSLPLVVYRRLEPRGKDRARDYPLYPVLHDLANEEMTAMDVRENLVGYLACRGVAYAEIERNGRGDPIGLWPLRPDRCELRRDSQQRLWLGVSVPGVAEPQALPPGRFLRIRGFSLYELAGMSTIRQGREAIGLALAQEEYGARLFSQNAQPGGVLETDKKLTNEAAKRLADGWQAAHAGLDQAHRVAVLEEGLKWHQVGMSPENAQFLDSRKYSRSEIAGLFHIQPHMIGDLEHATFSNIEMQSIEFVVYSLRPWLVRIEQAILRDCIPARDRGRYFAEHVVDGLLRGDVTSRWNAYTQALDRGVYSINDVLEKENMNPVPDGDVHLVPLNMQRLQDAAAGRTEPVTSSQSGNNGDADSQDGNDEEAADA